jgi:hypothetical protein
VNWARLPAACSVAGSKPWMDDDPYGFCHDLER